jgi:PiT family inorganic phosphate transporter
MLTPDNLLLVFLLIAGFYMAWSIGANDVANAMGTSVGSGALTLRSALVLAAIFEFTGAFFFGSRVTETIQSGILVPTLFNLNPHLYVYGMLASLLSAGAWLQLASYFGWPVSTTHAIIGSIIGFGTILGGIEAVDWSSVVLIVSSWIVSPLLGGLASYYLFTLVKEKIFLSAAPLEQAKKWAPFFYGGVLLVLSLSLLLSSHDEFLYDLSLPQILLICFLISVLGAGISARWVKNIGKEEELPKPPPEYQPEALIGLGKVEKHLLRISGQATGDLQDKVFNLLGEVQELAAGIRKVPVADVIHSQFQHVERIFLKLQILTACLMAFSHGSNDVANAIGPLVGSVNILLEGSLSLSTEIPAWALLLGGVGIVIGLATWGWRVILTIGKKITELTPTRGFSAEFAAALTVLLASRIGLPISATHTLVGAVLGVGLARGLEAINLTVTRDILASWVITLPVSAILSGFFFYIIQAAFG